MRRLERAFVYAFILGSCWAWSKGAAADLESLKTAGDAWPKVFFFRQTESMASNPRVTYQRWEQSFSRLMGIEGKVLDEEIPGRSNRNIEFFTRFKNDNPKQLMLLHYNGNARDPRYETEKYFAGHFLYYNGTEILVHVPAEPGETEIRVDNPSLFRTGTGRYRWSNDDIGLCLLDADEKPDWHQSEQVQLVSVDLRRKVIRVQRGCYGTEPMAFPAGKAYAATHVTEGPWGRKSNLMWYYNYATCCPKDKQGKTCSDIHAEELAARFLPGGELKAFDGLEFDVLHHEPGGSGLLGVDCDADGKADRGMFDGVNKYGIGVVEFCRQLREKLGPHRLILADGMGLRNQRAFQILNGIESEGWPTLSDWEINDWSGGLNRHWFWDQNAAQPVFNYVNHKFTMAGATPGSRVRPDVPYSVHRLVFAASLFTDSAICYSFSPPNERGGSMGIWDEFRKGTDNQLGWLGRPLGLAVRLAEQQPDLLEGAGYPIDQELADRFAGEDVNLSLTGGALEVTSTDESNAMLEFTLRGVPSSGPDLFVSVTTTGEHRAAEPKGIARRMWVGIAPNEGQLVRADQPVCGMCLRGKEETEIDTESGASVRFARAVDVAGEKHNAYRVHPPYKGGVGYTFWEREVEVPKDGRLELYTGMGPKSPERSDGVWFKVLVADANDATKHTQIFEHSQKAFQWEFHRVSLTEFAGRTVRLKFVADCGPNDNSTTDHAHWGDVVVVGPGGRTKWTPPARFMTWVNDRDFTSGFYFSDIRSERVHLEWQVEGPEPVRIKSVRVFGHSDVIYREYEGGLVLANPSPRPYTIDLQRLCPGTQLRRLKGSPLQDPVTNDGSRISGSVTLKPLEGLFLVKE